MKIASAELHRIGGRILLTIHPESLRAALCPKNRTLLYNLRDPVVKRYEFNSKPVESWFTKWQLCFTMCGLIRLQEFSLRSAVEVIFYPHPTLRYTAKPIQRVDKELRELVAEMFRLMYEHKGVGLAANQVGVPLRLFVMNESGKQGQGKELVFLNPVLSRPRGNEEMEEGCLSLPGVNANVVRPKTVFFNAYTHTGEEFKGDISGYMARIVQHEVDHLDGVLFVDRLTPASRNAIDSDMYTLEVDHQSKQRTGMLKSDEELMQAARVWEEKYC